MCVEDTVIVYNKNILDMNKTLTSFNIIHPKLQFTTEKEETK
jgi:hypothetical protein